MLMDRRWKTVLISVVIYQFVLTLLVLKLTHYNQWLHFNSDGGDFLTLKWYGGRISRPMEESLIWLGALLVLLVIWNIIVFRRHKATH